MGMLGGTGGGEMMSMIPQLMRMVKWAAAARTAVQAAVSVSPVIARSEATKRSRASRRDLDCFAEPVIGRAFARPVGSQ